MWVEDRRKNSTENKIRGLVDLSRDVTGTGGTTQRGKEKRGTPVSTPPVPPVVTPPDPVLRRVDQESRTLSVL